MKKVILASVSFRRHRILRDCGIEHTVMPTRAEEIMSQTIPIEELVVMNAEAKVAFFRTGEEPALVIGADTLVKCGGAVIGKPDSERAARSVLRKLSGGEAEVCTGLSVLDLETGRQSSGFESSTLFPVTLSDGELDRYFAMLGPYDKAGGFSIEGVGSLLFDNIKGSYFNILGLPMIKLRALLADIDIDIADLIRKGPGL